MIMSTSQNALFGSGESSPAIAGSYGRRPSGYRLPDTTRIRSVALQVSDLARSRDFYETVLGFHPIAVGSDRLTLGAMGTTDVLVELIEHRGQATRTHRKSLGLYHTAILLPTRADLGRFLQHVSDAGVRVGAGDHVVSEALYLQDPDDLGIEVYADRPRHGWRQHNGELVMGTDPLDLRGLAAAGGDTPWTGMPVGTTIGHVHLHVGDLADAARFYADALGFDRMVWSYPGALFFAAGGYHHHIGTNTWAGAHAQPAAAGEPQLLEWALELPTRADLDDVAANLRAAGFAAEADEDGAAVLTRDPWGTALRITHRRSLSGAP